MPKTVARDFTQNRRVTYAADLARHELRRSSSGRPVEFQGYAAVWDQPVEIMPGFREVVRRGAFAQTLEESTPDPVALLNHDKNYLLGRASAGSLELEEDDHGLRYVVPIDREDDVSRRTARWVEKGKLTGSSFGFVAREVAAENERGQQTRALLDVQLHDVGPVTFPAYPDATAEVRAQAAALLARVPDSDEGHLSLLPTLRALGLTDLAIRSILTRDAAELAHSGDPRPLYAERVARLYADD